MTRDPDLDAVLDDLQRREPIFHRPEFGTDRADFERMMAPEFCEVGASGRCYTRAQILDVLDERRRNGTLDEETLHPDDFRCQPLAINVYLLTYALQQGTRRTRRSTIWRRVGEHWQIVYHQGTVVQDG